MSELERRLRDALHGAAESPPAGLAEAVLRRHRRHQVRLGVSLAAVVAAAAIAVPSVASTFGGGSGHGPGPAASHRWTTAPPPGRPAAAHGTVLADCKGSNIGQLGRNWKAPLAIHAGPLWVLPETTSGGSRVSRRPGPDALRLYVAIVLLDGVRPGSVVVIRSHSHDLRFLYTQHDSLSPGIQYSMGSGESGVTFVSCTPGQQTFPAPYTDYYGAYLVRGKRCVPVSVVIPGWSHPLGLRLGDCQKH